MNIFYCWTFKFLTFICAIQLSINATPTERHLEQHPLEKIIETIGPNLNEKIPLLLEISSKETDDTFFGYHGMTQKSRLFQDILRAVFEECLNIPLPSNFYFLRIPGQQNWDWKNGKDSFLERFGNREMPDFYRGLIIQNFLAMMDKKIGFKVKMEDFSHEEISVIWNYFHSFIDYYVRDDLFSRTEQYATPKGFRLEPPRFNENLPVLVEVISKKLTEQYPGTNPKIFQQWIEKEFSDWYNVSIVFSLRELKLEDYDSSYRYIDQFFLPIHDTHETQQSMLVSLNVPMFANYQVSGCFTPAILLENESVLGGDHHLEDLLREFFNAIGLDPSLVAPMWLEGQNILEEAGIVHGALIQFYDESATLGEMPLSFVDKNAYVCLKHGLPVPNLIPSKYTQGHYRLRKKPKDLELRLVMNNQTTLNPFSPMRMIRYDGLSEEDSQKILFKMKEHLKNSERDDTKLQQYLKSIESFWFTSK